MASNLTPKQEKFCIEYVRTGNKSKAYRSAYNAQNMSDETINERASRLSNEYKVSARITELRAELNKKGLYKLEISVKRDLVLIEKYEAALVVLQNIDSEAADVTVAERTLKYIGISGFNSAQDRLSKQHGFYEKHQEGKKSNVTIFRIPDDGRDPELTAKLQRENREG